MQKIEINGTLGEQYGMFDFINEADEAGPDATVIINSFGGDFSTGICIADEIKSRRLKVHANKAASAAVPILAAGSHRTMPADAYLYLHRSWTLLSGDATQLIKVAEAMAHRDNDYAESIAGNIGSTPEAVMQMMCSEPTLTAEQALAKGFIDEITEPEGAPQPVESNARWETLDRLHMMMRRHCERSAPVSEKARVQTESRASADKRYETAKQRSFPPHIYRLKFTDFEFLTLIDGLRQRVQNTTGKVNYWPARWIDDEANLNFHPPKQMR